MIAAESAMQSHPPPASRRHYAALLVSFALIAATVSAAQLYHNWTSAGVEVRLASIFALKLAEWSAWAAAVPAIIWLDRHHGFARHGRRSAMAVHASFALLVSLVLNAIVTALTPFADPLATQRTYEQLFANRLVFKLPASLGVYALVLAAYGVVHLRMIRYAELTRKARLETELASARLHHLQAQLQPHFLFNALHSIGGLVRERETERAVDMIAELSELLRRALAAADSQEVMLDEELAFLEHYLRLQQLRFADRLSVRYDVDPQARSAMIPSLILQPLVENSIRHGMERTRRIVEITIAAHVNKGRLSLEVTDTGPGPARLPVVERVGLGTTRQRLSQLYGADQALVLSARPGGGTSVLLLLPQREASA